MRAVTRRSPAVRLVVLMAVFLGAVVFGYVRQIPAPTPLAAAPGNPAAGDPRLALFRAADHLEAQLADGGSGLTFTATQLQMLRPKPGGPELLMQPDRNNPTQAPVAVDELLLGTMSGRGAATSDAFYAEWFTGTDEHGNPAFEGSASYMALVRDGQLWRRDAKSDAAGHGWSSSGDIPGFGLDPVSLRELPELLRRLQDAKVLGVDADGRHWSGTSDSLWYPGAVAVDGASFTAPEIAIEAWLDNDDHLVGLFAVAQNINETTYQLLCVDRLRFDYEASLSIPTLPGAEQ